MPELTDVDDKAYMEDTALLDVMPLNRLAPTVAKWLEFADRRVVPGGDSDAQLRHRFYGQVLTAAEAAFCNSYARHLITGMPYLDLPSESFDITPLHRQAFLEYVVRIRLKEDGYIFPPVVKVGG